MGFLEKNFNISSMIITWIRKQRIIRHISNSGAQSLTDQKKFRCTKRVQDFKAMVSTH